MKKIIILVMMMIFISGCSFKDLFVKENEKEDLLTGTIKVEIDVKDYGLIKLDLDADTAPITVTNFVNKTIKGEFSSNNVKNNISHTRGTISMARSSGDNNSASSQFFIVHQDSTFLDGNYASFGHVTEGMDVVDKIASEVSKFATDDNGTIPFENQPVIDNIKVID